MHYSGSPNHRINRVSYSTGTSYKLHAKRIYFGQLYYINTLHSIIFKNLRGKISFTEI